MGGGSIGAYQIASKELRWNHTTIVTSSSISVMRPAKFRLKFENLLRFRPNGADAAFIVDRQRRDGAGTKVLCANATQSSCGRKVVTHHVFVSLSRPTRTISFRGQCNFT